MIEMACTIGHKINNPLSSLTLSIQAIESDLNPADAAKISEDIKIMKESTERISKFVQELIHLQNPQLVNYIDNNRMLKTE